MLTLGRSILVGVTGGFVSGLTGMGGGAIFVPMLYFFEKLPVREAIGTSLAVIVFTSLTGFFRHRQGNRVNSRLALLLIVAGLPGTQLGVLLAMRLPETMVKIFFILLLLCLALMIWRQQETLAADEGKCPWVNPKKVLPIGLAAGVVSGLGGVGGAIILVPLLHMHVKLDMKTCIGTTLLVVLCNAFASTLGYLAQNLVNFKVVFLVSAGALPAALAGATLSLKLQQAKLRRIFAVVLLLMACLLFLNRGA